jgi:release factor glutamine methyltransferase
MLEVSRTATSEVAAKLRAAGCLFADEEARLFISNATSESELSAMLDRRAAGFPLEHILGWAEFCGIRVAVDPGVFVPRRRTELLVREAVSLIRRTSKHSVVVDLCCGCGAVGAAIASSCRHVELYAVDVDPVAVDNARRNIRRDRVFEGCLYEALPPELAGRVALIIANAPYVPTDDFSLLPAEARLHEPITALDGGADGLDVQRQIAAGAPQWLCAQGNVVIETGRHQAARTAEILVSNGFATRIIRSEELDATVVHGWL